MALLVEPDRSKRWRLFEYAPKPLDAFVAPDHLLRRLDESIDFRELAKPLHQAYTLDQGRPAIPPEVLVRALALGYIYRIPSFRKLCAAICENLAFRWFLFLGLEDEVFDHSTVSVFLDRVGPEGFRQVLQALNRELARAGILTGQAYVDSSLVPAAVSGKELSPSSLTPEEFAERATQENGLFVTCEVQAAKKPGQARPVRRLVRRYFQDSRGRLPLHPRDLDARWRSRGKRAMLSYLQHVLVEDRGFVLAQAVTHSTVRDADPVPRLLETSPVAVHTLAADTGYSSGRLRRQLERRGIEAYIPLHPTHVGMRKRRAEQGFQLRENGELVCRAGHTLKRSLAHYTEDETWLYSAKVSACSSSPPRVCRPSLGDGLCTSPSTKGSLIGPRRETERVATNICSDGGASSLRVCLRTWINWAFTEHVGADSPVSRQRVTWRFSLTTC